MADVTISSTAVIDGVLHIYGSNFTQTTTSVSVDDSPAAFEYVSASELTIDPAPAAGVTVGVEKGGVAAVTTLEASPETPPAGSEAVATSDVPAGGSTGNTGPVALNPEDLLTTQDVNPLYNPPLVDAGKAEPIDITVKEP